MTNTATMIFVNWNGPDVIICTEVFEHLPEPILAIKEFHRLLKPGRRLILTAPFCSLTHFAPYHYYSGFNSYFYEHHLYHNDFEIVSIESNGNYFSYIAQEIRRINDVAVKYSSGFKSKVYHKMLTQLILLFINHLDTRDNGSDELLCYGYHILAKKRD